MIVNIIQIIRVFGPPLRYVSISTALDAKCELEKTYTKCDALGIEVSQPLLRAPVNGNTCVSDFDSLYIFIFTLGCELLKQY